MAAIVFEWPDLQGNWRRYIWRTANRNHPSVGIHWWRSSEDQAVWEKHFSRSIQIEVPSRIRTVLFSSRPLVTPVACVAKLWVSASKHVHLLREAHDIYRSPMVQIDKTELKLDEGMIIWPNGLHRKPDGILTRRNISVCLIYCTSLYSLDKCVGSDHCRETVHVCTRRQ